MAQVAHVEEWLDDCATIAEIEAALVDLRYRHSEAGEPDLRTSVLTHLAWVPPEWQEAAADTLAAAPRRQGRRTREYRRPAAPPRPAGLPPLARPPRLRLAGLRAVD